jgi:NodT family efflux transporter outer membrane factor (OMF) lipoprotein
MNHAPPPRPALRLPARTAALLPLAATLLLAACSVGPNYVRPDSRAGAKAPAAFKEAGPAAAATTGNATGDANWQPARPRDGEPRGKWWEIYGDATLNALAEQVIAANQTVAQAEARYRQAVALAEGSRAGQFPTITGNLSDTRSRASANTSSVTVARGVTTNHSISAGASWEADLWGRVRRNVEASEASLQASASDLEAARLLAHAQLAQNYFQLRVLDAQKKLLQDTVAAYERSLQLTQNQFAAGVVAKADTIQATTQLRSTQAQLLDIGVQRAQLEHAIAVLTGKAPAEFSLPPDPSFAMLAVKPPAIAPGLPATLLERRPDIAAAERRVAAANAQIGVASSAFYPTLTINASTGFQASSMANWLTAPSRFWSLGPALALTLFDGGLRRSQTAQAVAAYDASVATYRQTVLTALQEVEDNLASLRILEQEAAVQREALEAARLSLSLVLNQYKAGTVNYLNVITAQATALTAERNALDILGRRMGASTVLIRALGGGWHEGPLPKDR